MRNYVDNLRAREPEKVRGPSFVDKFAPVSLVDLPRNYDEIFQLTASAICNKCKTKPKDPALCLVCGSLLCSRAPCCADKDHKGELSTHTEKCCSGNGMYLLLADSAIILLSQGLAAVHGSPYLDANGEQDPGLRRGRPLFLDAARWEQIRKIFASQSIVHRGNQMAFRM